jgi:hypothetical protein
MGKETREVECYKVQDRGTNQEPRCDFSAEGLWPCRGADAGLCLCWHHPPRLRHPVPQEAPVWLLLSLLGSGHSTRACPRPCCMCRRGPSYFAQFQRTRQDPAAHPKHTRSLIHRHSLSEALWRRWSSGDVTEKTGQAGVERSRMRGVRRRVAQMREG